MKGKSLKHILLDRFLNHYGYDKGAVTASAIIDDLLALIEQYYRYTDNSLPQAGPDGLACCPRRRVPQEGQIHGPDQTQARGPRHHHRRVTSRTSKLPVHHRELKIKKIERWTTQAYDQGALLSQLDLAVLLTNQRGHHGRLRPRVPESLQQGSSYPRQHPAHRLQDRRTNA